jgi:hypothetical protein
LTKVPGKEFIGYMDSFLMVIAIIGVLVVSFEAVRRWIKTLRGEPIPQEAFGPPADMGKETIKMGCC